MNKIFCIDETRRVLDEQREEIIKNMTSIEEEMKRVNVEIKYLEQQSGNNTILSAKKQQLKNLSTAYKKEQIKFDIIKKYLIHELKSNLNLISKYNNMIDMYKEYQKYDIDVLRLESTITDLEKEREETRKKMLDSIASRKKYNEAFYMLDEDIDIADYKITFDNIDSIFVNNVFEKEIQSDRAQHQEKEEELFAYNAIKAASLVGNTKPETRTKQYAAAIKFVEQKFDLKNSYKVLDILEDYLSIDQYEIDSKNKKVKNSSENNSLPIEQKTGKLRFLPKIKNVINRLIEKIKVKYANIVNYVNDENNEDNIESNPSKYINDEKKKEALRKIITQIEKIKQLVEKLKIKYEYIKERDYVIDPINDGVVDLDKFVKISDDTTSSEEIKETEVPEETDKVVAKTDRVGHNIVYLDKTILPQKHSSEKTSSTNEPEIII